MTLMSRSCRIAQDQIVAVLAGSVDPRDRRALDAHAARCYRCADALRDAVATHLALGRAFAPLRAAHTLVAPGRVRLALRPAPASPGPFASLFRLATRLAEGTVALGVCASRAAERRVLVGCCAAAPASVSADDPCALLVAAAVTEQLVRRDARGDLVPRLAMTVPTLENGAARVEHDATAPEGRLVADFRLRSGLRWQDGEPITAADVFFAFAQDRLAPAGSEARWIADHVERVEVTGERDVRFAYRAGERWADYPLAARVLPRHVLAAADAGARAKFAREPVHAGPFAVAAWIPGFRVTLSAFKDHVLGPPALGRIEIRFLSDRRAVLDALRHREIDVAPSPALEADLSRTLDRIADGTERTGLQAYYTPSEALDVLRFGGSRFPDVPPGRAG